jgi:hypothetical protein
MIYMLMGALIGTAISLHITWPRAQRIDWEAIMREYQHDFDNQHLILKELSTRVR